MGKAAGEGGKKGKHRKGQRTELTKRNSLTEDTPRDAVTNALRLHLHNFAYNTFKIKSKKTQCKFSSRTIRSGICDPAKCTLVPMLDAKTDHGNVTREFL